MGQTNDKRVKATSQRRAQRTTPKFDVSSLDSVLLHKVIYAACRAGAALRFGLTRDGGAFAVGIYGDGEPYTEYLRPDDAHETYFRDLEQFFLEKSPPGETE